MHAPSEAESAPPGCQPHGSRSSARRASAGCRPRGNAAGHAAESHETPGAPRHPGAARPHRRHRPDSTARTIEDLRTLNVSLTGTVAGPRGGYWRHECGTVQLTIEVTIQLRAWPTVTLFPPRAGAVCLRLLLGGLLARRDMTRADPLGSLGCRSPLGGGGGWLEEDLAGTERGRGLAGAVAELGEDCAGGAAGDLDAVRGHAALEGGEGGTADRPVERRRRSRPGRTWHRPGTRPRSCRRRTRAGAPTRTGTRRARRTQSGWHRARRTRSAVRRAGSVRPLRRAASGTPGRRSARRSTSHWRRRRWRPATTAAAAAAGQQAAPPRPRAVPHG